MQKKETKTKETRKGVPIEFRIVVVVVVVVISDWFFFILEKNKPVPLWNPLFHHRN